jgi:hypothetical protein
MLALRSVLVLLILFASSAAIAQRELEHTDRRALLIGTGTTTAVALGISVLPKPDHCRFCEPTRLDLALHRPAPAERRVAVARVSHIVSFGATPTLVLSFLGAIAIRDRDGARFGQDTAIVLEALMVNTALTSAFKRIVARQRPAFYFHREAEGEYADEPGAANVSFFSGDTSTPFVLVASGSTVAFLRGDPLAPYMLSTGLLLATSVAVMRVRADVHWPTDVFTGAMVGSAVGVILPMLLHGRQSAAPEGTAAPLVLGWNGTF